MPETPKTNSYFCNLVASSGRFVFLSNKITINPHGTDFHEGVGVTSASVLMGADPAISSGLHRLQRAGLAVAPVVRGLLSRLVRTSRRVSLSRGGVCLMRRLGAAFTATPPRVPYVFADANHGEGVSC